MNEATATYDEAIETARELMQPLSENASREYARGQVALIADLFGKPGMDIETRMSEVRADIGLDSRGDSNWPDPLDNDRGQKFDTTKLD